MRKHLILSSLLFVLVVITTACGPSLNNFEPGDTIVATKGVETLTSTSGGGKDVCTPRVGEQFIIKEIEPYGLLGRITMKIQSLDRPGGWSLLIGLRPSCRGWTIPGDHNWKP